MGWDWLFNSWMTWQWGLILGPYLQQEVKQKVDIRNNQEILEHLWEDRNDVLHHSEIIHILERDMNAQIMVVYELGGKALPQDALGII